MVDKAFPKEEHRRLVLVEEARQPCSNGATATGHRRTSSGSTRRERRPKVGTKSGQPTKLLADRRKPTALGNGELVPLLPVTDGHVRERDGVVVLRVAGLTEGLHARPDYTFHRLASGLEIVARVEFGRVLGEGLADGAGGGKAPVGIGVDLADAGLDPCLNLVHRE